MAKLIKIKDFYICDICNVRQDEIDYHCHFCGRMFDNYKEIQKEQEQTEEKENE